MELSYESIIIIIMEKILVQKLSHLVMGSGELYCQQYYEYN